MTTVFSYMYTLFYKRKHTQKRWLIEISLCWLFSSPYHLITAFLMIYRTRSCKIIKTQSMPSSDNKDLIESNISSITRTHQFPAQDLRRATLGPLPRVPTDLIKLVSLLAK
jgi:hypothetical protein